MSTACGSSFCCQAPCFSLSSAWGDISQTWFSITSSWQQPVQSKLCLSAQTKNQCIHSYPLHIVSLIIHFSAVWSWGESPACQDCGSLIWGPDLLPSSCPFLSQEMDLYHSRSSDLSLAHLMSPFSAACQIFFSCVREVGIEEYQPEWSGITSPSQDPELHLQHRFLPYKIISTGFRD